MNDAKEIDQIPPLKPLVEHYQEIKAPLGFADRVAAHVKDQTDSRSWLTSKWLYALSFASTAIIAVLIVQQALEIEPELQIAQQDMANQKQSAPVEPAPIKNASPKREETRNTVNQKQASRQLARTSGDTSVDLRTDQEIPGDDFNNIAVLSEVSEWLEGGDVMAAPDFSEMPAFGDINDMFERT